MVPRLVWKLIIDATEDHDHFSASDAVPIVFRDGGIFLRRESFQFDSLSRKYGRTSTNIDRVGSVLITNLIVHTKTA